ncbi:MAG: DnaJ C-terminal domain-containing protein [Candidatus Dormibacteria bacterium]
MATVFKDYYQTLGVAKSATPKEIKSAFRKLARKHHPDLNPTDPSAPQRFKEVNEANEVLGDPEKRKKYDELGSRWPEYDSWERAGRPGPPPGAMPFGSGGGRQVDFQGMSAHDLDELFGNASPFSDLFQGAFRTSPGGSGTSGRFRAPGRGRGHDVEGEVAISLEEAAAGTGRTVETQAPGGARRVEVQIPAGIKDGARVRAAGQGGQGSGGGKAGDLFIRVKVLPHAAFTRLGDDLRSSVEVPLDVALLGGDVEVGTIRGKRVSLHVPPETQNGKVLRLRGLGMPKLKGGGSGDLLVEVVVRLPLPLTPAARKLVENLRADRQVQRRPTP